MNIVELYSKAAQVIDSLTEAGSQDEINRVRAIAQEVMDKHFPGENLPMPEINVRNYINVKWLGLMRTKLVPPYVDKPLFILEIQKAIINDPETLRRVIAHEVVHEWQNIHKDNLELMMMARFQTPDIGHGKDFEDKAAQINTIEGPDYITKKSDDSYKLENRKEYYLLIQPKLDKDGNVLFLGWSWAARPSIQQREEIMMRMVNKNAKLFKSKDPQWLNGVQIKRFGGFSYSAPGQSQTPEKNAELTRIYNSGESIEVK